MNENKDLCLSDLITKGASLYPDNTMLISEDGFERYTYRRFHHICNRLAKSFIKMGVKKGDRIGIWIPKSPECIMLQFAAARIGAVIVPMNAHEKLTAINNILEQIEINVLILSEGVYGSENIDILRQISPDLKFNKTLPHLKHIVLMGHQAVENTISWHDFLELAEGANDHTLKKREQENHPDDVIHIILTSGTAGKPKGVMLSHTNMIVNASEIARRMNISDADIFCLQTPLFHTFGCVTGVILPILCGCSIVVMRSTKPSDILTRVQAEKCSVLSGVPTMFIRLIEEYKQGSYDISSLRTGVVAGDFSPPALIESIVNDMNMQDVITSYGMTETSPAVTATFYNDSLRDKKETVGSPLPNVEVKMVDDSGKEVQCGEICVRGYNIMKGYYKMPLETKKAIDDQGWLYTGDFGSFDPESNYLKIECRLKDIIIKSGENISPGEVELMIMQNPKVKRVCVIGVPDRIKGQAVMAFIQLKQGCFITADDLNAFLKGKIATNKIPKYYKFVREFPIASTGKINKLYLKESIFNENERMIL